MKQNAKKARPDETEPEAEADPRKWRRGVPPKAMPGPGEQRKDRASTGSEEPQEEQTPTEERKAGPPTECLKPRNLLPLPKFQFQRYRCEKCGGEEFNCYYDVKSDPNSIDVDMFMCVMIRNWRAVGMCVYCMCARPCDSSAATLRCRIVWGIMAGRRYAHYLQLKKQQIQIAT